MQRYLLRGWGRLRGICTSSSHRRTGIAQQVEQLVRHARQVLGQHLHLAQPHMCVRELRFLGHLCHDRQEVHHDQRWK